MFATTIYDSDLEAIKKSIDILNAIGHKETAEKLNNIVERVTGSKYTMNYSREFPK